MNHSPTDNLKSRDASASKKRYREEHMRIAGWAKKETLRPGEAGGARPETWLYNF